MAMTDAAEVLEERRQWWMERGATVKAVARLCGVSTKSLADAMGMRRPTLINRMNGVSPFTPWEFEAVTIALNLPAKVLEMDADDAIRWLLDHPKERRLATRGCLANPHTITTQRPHKAA